MYLSISKMCLSKEITYPSKELTELQNSSNININNYNL